MHNPERWADKFIWIVLVVLVTVAGFGLYHYARGDGGRTLATCTGAADCKACKTCKYCKHCAKDGGTCGVKKKNEGAQAMGMDCCEDGK